MMPRRAFGLFSAAALALLPACGGDETLSSGAGGREPAGSSSSGGSTDSSSSSGAGGKGGEGGAGGEGGVGGAGGEGGVGGAGGEGGVGGAGGEGGVGGDAGAGGIGGAGGLGGGSGGAGGGIGGSGGSGGAGGGNGGAGGGNGGAGGSGGSGGAPLAMCGDGVIGPDEACDDGNAMAGDGCSPDCNLEPGTVCGDSINLNNPAIVTRTGDVTTYAGTTAGSPVTSFGDPSCSDGAAGVPTIIHRYKTGASHATLRIETLETAGALTDPILWTYLDCLDTSAEQACDDDSGPSGYALLNTPVVPPKTTVFVVTAGYEAAQVGPYSLRVTETPVLVVPSSGSCAAPVAAGPGTYAGETLAGDPNNLAGAACFTGADASEAVYAISLATKSDLRVEVVPGAPLLDFGAYLRASPCAMGMELACSENEAAGAAEQISASDLPAGSYYIAVDGYTSLDHGPYTLSIDVIPVLAPGASCDPASAAARCEAGTVCVGPAGGATCAAVQTLLAEEFTSSFGPFNVTDAGGDMLTWWRCDDLASCPFTNTTGSASGGPFALIRDDNNVDHDGEILTSGPINASSAAGVALAFDHVFDHLEGASDLARVDVSTDLMAWTPVASFTTDASGRVLLDISPLAAGKTFYVRFFFDDQTAGGPSWVNDWRIDDVRVYGF
jgi:cysteine-rich repeat protein